jgi:rhamnogalacturonan hydrolase
MVTNKDECVTVKSPAKNILVENIYCNWSGGCAFGSLGASTSISNVVYRNIYTWSSNQMMMIKSNGGSGTLSNVLLENFIGHGNAYSLDIDQYWSSMSPVSGNGVQLNNITFKVCLCGIFGVCLEAFSAMLSQITRLLFLTYRAELERR